VRGRLAVEEGGKNLYIWCMLGYEALSATSQSTRGMRHNRQCGLVLTSRLVLSQRIS